MGMVGVEREGCGRLLGIECVEREGEGLWLVQVEGSDSKQLEMNVQCEQFISPFDPAGRSGECMMGVITCVFYCNFP